MLGTVDVPVSRPNHEMLQQLLTHPLNNHNLVDGLVSM
jgi:hypothetical protein